MILFFALLLLTILLYLASVVNLATMKQSDQAGNSLSWSYAVLMAIGLWILLVALTLLAGFKSGIPGRAIVAALFLTAGSGGASIAAIQLLGDSFYRARWPILIPILAPLVILGFVLWARLPGFREFIPPAPTGAIAATTLLLLSIAPLPALFYRARNRARDQVTTEAARAARSSLENLAAFSRLTQDSELSKWLAFRLPDNELRAQALNGIRSLPRRQADAEELMRRGLDTFWEDVPELGLTATAVICERARHFLQERARDIRPPNPESPPRFALMAERVEPYLATMQWLVDQGCECSAEMAAIETAVRNYPDSPERQRVLDALAPIRRSE